MVRTLFERLEDIKQPNESYGECRNFSQCGSFRAVLGNGYCVQCWDRGAGSGDCDFLWPYHIRCPECTPRPRKAAKEDEGEGEEALPVASPC